MHDSKHFSSASGEMVGWRPTGVILINSTDCKKQIKQENAYHTQHIWLTATKDMSVCVCVCMTLGNKVAQILKTSPIKQSKLSLCADKDPTC